MASCAGFLCFGSPKRTPSRHTGRAFGVPGDFFYGSTLKMSSAPNCESSKGTCVGAAVGVAVGAAVGAVVGVAVGKRESPLPAFKPSVLVVAFSSTGPKLASASVKESSNPSLSSEGRPSSAGVASGSGRSHSANSGDMLLITPRKPVRRIIPWPSNMRSATKSSASTRTTIKTPFMIFKMRFPMDGSSSSSSSSS